jgi:hypothetical protein
MYKMTVYYPSQAGEHIAYVFTVDDWDITPNGDLVLMLDGKLRASWAAGQWHSTYMYVHGDKENNPHYHPEVEAK